MKRIALSWSALVSRTSSSLTSAVGTRQFSLGRSKRAFTLPKEVSAHVGAVQLVRKYAPISNITPECWNCKKPCTNRMICSECGHLQDVITDMDFFDLLDIPKSFQVKQQQLTKRFRQLQTLVHPDKFSNKSQREQTNSTEWSSLLNKAYKTLSVPIDRGQYILKLQGEKLPQDNSTLNKEFLMDMMERNEEVDDADDVETLTKLNEKIINELNEKVTKLNEKFELNQIDEIKSILVEMKYLLSMQNNIKAKLQSLGRYLNNDT